MKIRYHISEETLRASPFEGTIEVDESYFGARRVPGVGSKQIVFGIYKRNGKVYTEVVPNVQKKTLQAVIRGRVSPDYSDGWRGYNGLVDAVTASIC